MSKLILTGLTSSADFVVSSVDLQIEFQERELIFRLVIRFGLVGHVVSFG